MKAAGVRVHALVISGSYLVHQDTAGEVGPLVAVYLRLKPEPQIIRPAPYIDSLHNVSLIAQNIRSREQ